MLLSQTECLRQCFRPAGVQSRMIRGLIVHLTQKTSIRLRFLPLLKSDLSEPLSSTSTTTPFSILFFRVDTFKQNSKSNLTEVLPLKLYPFP